MKRCLFILLFLVTYAPIFAVTFWVNGLRYTSYNSDNEVEVISQKDSSPSYESLSGNIVIPNSVTYNNKTYTVIGIGINAFRGCTNVTSISMPNTIKYIDTEAFAGCTGLTSLDIPNSTIRLGEHIIKGCSKLKVLTLGESLSDINRFALVGAPIKTLNWNIIEYKDFSSTNGPYSPLVTESAGYYLSTINFGNSVRKIPSQICYKLERAVSLGALKVTFGNSVETIGYNAFGYCFIDTITIPNSVRTIGNYAFFECNPKSITLGKSIKTIGGQAFAKSNMSSTTPRLKTVNWNVEEYGENFLLMSDGISTSIFDGSEGHPGCSITTFNFGENVKKIPAYLCSNCRDLKSITIAKALTTIGKGAFLNCTNLENIEWNASNCSDFTSPPFSESLKKITFGANVNHIPAYLCAETSVASVTIPDLVTSIGKNAFYKSRIWTTQTSSNRTNVIYVDSWACGVDYKSEPSISIVLNSSTKGIADNCFEGISALKSVTVPNSVTAIGACAFKDCIGLTSVINQAISPQNISGKYVFYKVDKSSCYLLVPEESIELYKNAPEWKDFLVEGISGVEEIRVDQQQKHGQRYNLMGRPVGKDYKGIVIENGQKKIIK